MKFVLARGNEIFISWMIRTGKFNNQSEVVREALRRMEREESSYLNPRLLTAAEAERIYAPNKEEEAREESLAWATIR